jgi:hypothetical protein
MKNKPIEFRPFNKIDKTFSSQGYSFTFMYHLLRKIRSSQGDPINGSIRFEPIIDPEYKGWGTYYVVCKFKANYRTLEEITGLSDGVLKPKVRSKTKLNKRRVWKKTKK